ncbi:MAG: PCRF domain-containing protein, partial [Burkholderiaceae bacterium]|nr:PCRF domain-containing protein [Burkholderiaceae bacterium]
MKPFMRAQLERSVQRLSELDFLLSREDIMQDMTQFMALSREHAEVVALVTPYQKWQQLRADMAAAHAMLQDKDPAVQAMAQEEINSAEPAIVAIEAQLQRMLLPKDPDDTRNAFLEIRAGTGGDESALFAGDLLRMYTRFCASQSWRVEVISESPSELGGYKEVVIRIEGTGVYGALKFESGGHRVQRVPATETQGRIHTSA